MFKKDLWAREQLSKMAMYEISTIDLANELGCNKTYISQIFSNPNADYYGRRGGISREKISYAISELIKRKMEGG